jgi:hypothetical protein
MLHVRCGSDILDDLRAAGVPGEFLVWADPLSQGPTRAANGEPWYELRAGFIARNYGGDASAIAAELREADAVLERHDPAEELVLWFEHDLFDQAILVRLLALLARRPGGAGHLSIVTLDSHPSVRRFTGLGNLDGPALAELFGRRERVTPAMLAAGGAGWAALRAPTPEPAAELARAGVDALPYLPAALARHLRELPSTVNGLGHTEQLALEAVAAGASTAGEVFVAVQEREAAPWLGDSMLYAVLARLATARTPLLRTSGSWPRDGDEFRAAPVALTDGGRAVLGGRVDAVALSGIERWVGGVELRGTRAAWRWDEASRRPVPG